MGYPLRQYSSQSLRSLQTHAHHSLKKIKGLSAGHRALGMVTLAAIVGMSAKTQSENSIRQELETQLGPSREIAILLGERMGLKSSPELLQRRKLPASMESTELAPHLLHFWISNEKDQVLLGNLATDEWAVLATPRPRASWSGGWNYLGAGWTGLNRWLQSQPAPAADTSPTQGRRNLRDPKEIVY